VWHDQVQTKPARNGGPSYWHQDHPYWPVIQPADLVSAWVALEDATVENGCMSMVPGSHTWGPYHGGTIGTDETTYGPAPEDKAFVPEGTSIEPVPVPVRAGSVVFHHCLTWHGAPPNRSERPRPAIAVHYMPGWTRYEPRGPGHLVERHITVGPGEILHGEHFPTVMENGRVLTPDATATPA
jgi:ectoine hydroxylase-related dioxygenase (phytanoyl-CoA dioxygenase family)